MLVPGTRVVLVSNGEITMKGDLFVAFSYGDSYAIIGRDDEDYEFFGVHDARCVEPFHAPSGPRTP
jgi:hypothetical protein